MEIRRNKAEAIKVYERNMTSVIENIGATRAALGRMLRSIDLVGWSRNEESGRLDRKALPRVSQGAVAVFSRRAMKQADASAVTIMVDCSGSMAGTEIRVAGEVSVQLGKLLEQSRVNFAITGFTGSEPNTYRDAESGTYIDHVEFIPFKGRGESMRAAAPKLGSIQRSAASGNPDFSALMFTIEEIKTQKEQRKIIFFITDTGSYIPSQMKHVQEVAAKLGITLIAIGVGTDCIKSMFKHGVDVQETRDMGGATFTTLLKTLRSKD